MFDRAAALREVSSRAVQNNQQGNQLVERLAGIGILSEITGQSRNRRFRYDAYVRLFDEPNASEQEAPA
jgi:hypothetical protein